ncbi:MAG: hypothetical protein DRO11_02700, partial [Methanobacteriota archaeon]
LAKVAGGRFKVVRISDTLGSAKDMEELEAIVVSPQTLRGALMINHARRRRGLQPLDIVVVRLVVDDMGRVLSSTRIRRLLEQNQGKEVTPKPWGEKALK